MSDVPIPTGIHRVPEQSNSQKLFVTDDVLVVDWDGPDDPQNPKKCVA
jgi:hypothetical protein